MAQTVKIIPFQKLRLIDMMRQPEQYSGLADDLVKFAPPDQIRIGRRRYRVPADFDEFTKQLCYGQRLFFNQQEENDFGIIIRMIDGYYYPIVTGKKWDQDCALRFGKNIITCTVEEIYPVAMHLVNLYAKMIEREHKLLHRDPMKMELAAGIERLNVYSELSALDFLRDAMKIPVAEVLLTPYNECLVRFMMAKETEDYKCRYIEIMEKDMKTKQQKQKQ